MVNQGHRSAVLEPGCLPHLLEEVPSKSKCYMFSCGSFTSRNVFHLNADVYLNLFNSPSAFPLSSPALKRSKVSPVHVALHPPAPPGKFPILNMVQAMALNPFPCRKCCNKRLVIVHVSTPRWLFYSTWSYRAAGAPAGWWQHLPCCLSAALMGCPAQGTEWIALPPLQPIQGILVLTR